MKKIIFLLSLFYSLSAWCAGCLISDILKDPRFANNSEFWTKYSELQSKFSGNVPDRELNVLAKSLVADWTPSPVTSTTTSTSQNLAIREIQTRKSVQHEIQGLPPHVKGRYDEFLELIRTSDGYEKIRSNPGSWRLEKLNGNGNHYSVRLNSGYRVEFKMENKSIEVFMVNKGRVHSN